ncbi:MAG TPA: sugar ABC transporter permease, partial [Acidobacteriota bacterium]|nr:sugar ABC transporter permease [Acidobacteriota bacterium]
MRTRLQHHRRIAFWFLFPNLVGFVAFTVWPVLAPFLLAFTSWDLLTAPRWIGLANFVQLLGFHHDGTAWVANDPAFWQYLGNTLFLMLNLPVNMLGSLLLAMLLNQKLRGTYGYRLVYFLPSVLAGVPIYYLWRWIYNPNHGLLNTLLEHVGIAGPDWLGSALWAKPALMLMGSWMAIGGSGMILYLAALQ